MNSPQGICTDATGKFYFADEPANVVRVVNTSGIIDAFAGTGSAGYAGDGGAATSATLNNSYDVKADNSGNVYTSDASNFVVRMVNPAGVISTFAGNNTSVYGGDGGPATAAGITPLGLAFDASGNLYIGDNANRVRIVCIAKVSSVSISASATTICAGTPITFTATATYTGNTPVYTWYNGTSVIGTGATFVYSTASNGDAIYCVATIPGANAVNRVCGVPTATSNTITLSVNPSPQITDVDLNTICLPGYSSPTVTPTFSTTVTGGTGSYTYYWNDNGPFSSPLGIWGFALSPNNTVANPTISTYGPTHTFQEWTLTVTDADGCITQRQVPVTFVTSGYDLATRDSRYDMYDEPNSQNSYNGGVWDIWNGPDIWNRWFSGTIDHSNQPAEYLVLSGTQQPNYVYVKVRNVGCIVSPETSPLHVYWTMGGTGGEDFPNAWNGALSEYVSGHPGGNELPSSPQTIASIPPGGSQIFAFNWLPPNPHDYGMGGTMPLCYLAYIDDGHNSAGDPAYGLTLDPGTTGDSDPADWCIDNNNMATLNSSDIYETTHFHTMPPSIIRIGNETNIKSISIQAANSFILQPGTGVSTLSNFAYFKLFLGPVFDMWQQAGAHGTYSTINVNEKSVTFDGTHTVQLDSIPLPDTGHYSISIAGFILDGVNPNLMQPEHIVLRELNDSSTGNTIGAYWLNVRCPADNAPGVLAATEISQGPQSNPGCEYAEMIVGNCGYDMSPYVNVSGWIIDDNNGNFDTSGCSATGITRGHYRLAYNSIWENMPVGSVIVLYNADVNCYNLPDTFKIDTTHNIYWVPVSSATGVMSSYVLERFSGAENGIDSTTYCSDTGMTIYKSASAWNQTVALASQDAIQVRCPGCTVANPGTPSFYHGIGYAPGTNYCFVSIPAGSGNLGGPVEYNVASSQKYIFTGSSKADFGDPTKWTAYNADAAGSPPPTLGVVDSALDSVVLSSSLGLPCCSYGQGGGNGNRKSAPAPAIATKQIESIKVYPNPAIQTLNFDFPLSGSTTIKLMDVTGRLMDEQVFTNSVHATFNVASYTPGLYLYQVTANDKTQLGKVVIIK